jgi:hypothetical protein
MSLVHPAAAEPRVVRLAVVKPTIARQGRKANRQPWHNGSAQVAVTRTAGRRGSRRGAGRLGGLPGGVAGPVSAAGARLTSVPADRLSSPAHTSRGRDRRRLNKAVRGSPVKPGVASMK